MIKNEIWERHTTQRYEGQEKLEQEIVYKKKKSDIKKHLAAKWSKGRKLGSSKKKDWHLRNVWLRSVNTISSSDTSLI